MAVNAAANKPPKKGGAKRERRKYSIVVSTSSSKKLQATHQKLWYPQNIDKQSYINQLTLLVEPLTNGLQKLYENVEIKVVAESPDFSQLEDWGTFKLAAKGFSGKTRLADVGGIPYMNDPKYHDVKFQLPDIIKTCGLEVALVFGAGAASPTVVGKNAELMPNTLVPGPRHTHFAKMDKPREDEDDEDDEKKNSNSNSSNNNANNNNSNNNSNENKNNNSDNKENKANNNNENKEESKNVEQVPFVGIYPSEETGCLANLFLSKGKQGPLLYVKVSKRKGNQPLNIALNMRDILNDFRKNKNIQQQIGMGGLVKVTDGKLKAHIMPDFSKDKLESKEQVNKWLKFFEFGPDLVMFSTFITGDPSQDNNMHLRMEHTHFHSIKKHCHEGGHYHNDVSKDIAYEGYFNIAEYIYRVEDAQYNIDNAKLK